MLYFGFPIDSRSWRRELDQHAKLVLGTSKHSQIAFVLWSICLAKSAGSSPETKRNSTACRWK